MCLPIIIVPASALCFQAECGLLGVIFILLTFCGRGTHTHLLTRQPGLPSRDVGACRGHQALQVDSSLLLRFCALGIINVEDMDEVLLGREKPFEDIHDSQVLSKL